MTAEDLLKLVRPCLAWFAREGFPRGEIGRLPALMHETDVNGLRELPRPLR